VLFILHFFTLSLLQFFSGCPRSRFWDLGDYESKLALLRRAIAFGLEAVVLKGHGFSRAAKEGKNPGL
jgi:hypothetical protein